MVTPSAKLPVSRDTLSLGSVSKSLLILLGLCAASPAAAGPVLTLEQPAGTVLDTVITVFGSNTAGQRIVPAGLMGVQAVSAGAGHNLALKTDGTVVAWGSDSAGQRTVPSGLTGVRAVSAGGGHSLALTVGGTVVAWGLNDRSQRNVPAGLTDVKAISAGNQHSVALKTDGTVVIWGNSQTVPAGLTGVQAIAAGNNHTAALRADGTVVVWGTNTITHTNFPAGLANVAALAAGDSFVIALKRDGSAVGWGVLQSGFPALSLNSSWSGLQSLGAGGSYFMAVREDGTAISSGVPSNVNVGQGTIPNGLSDVQEIDGGSLHSIALSSPALTFAEQEVSTSSPTKEFVIRNTGDSPLLITGVRMTGAHAGDFQVEQSGFSNSVAAGAETAFSIRFRPVVHGTRRAMLQVECPESAMQVALKGDAVGPEVSVYRGNEALTEEVLADQAGVQSFANTNVGQASVSRTFAIKNTGNREMTDLALSLSGDSGDFSCGALGAASLVPNAVTTFTVTFSPVATGVRNAVLSLASNDRDENPFRISLTGEGVMVPVIAMEQEGGSPVERNVVEAWGTAFSSPLAYTAPNGLSGMRAISAAKEHTLALRSDGTVAAWGSWGSSGKAAVPDGLTGVVAISAGPTHNVVVKTNGLVSSWGDLPGTLTTVPAGLTGVRTVAAGWNHTLALKADGTVRAWADAAGSLYGQAVVPPGLSSVQAVAAGAYHSVALKMDGTVVVWGRNNFNQLAVPSGLSGVKALAAGSGHTLALKMDGTVAAWGYNVLGQSVVPAGLTGVQAIAAGGEASVALKSDGSLVIWGRNDQGQMTVPDGLRGIKAVSTGGTNIVVMVDGRVDFGQQRPLAPTVPRTLTIRNTGAAQLDISNITVAGGNAAEFILNPAGMLTSLPPGGSTSFTVAFSPNGKGDRRTTLEVLHNDTVTGPLRIHLTGTGVEPDLAVYTGDSIAAPDLRGQLTIPFIFADTNLGRTSAAQKFTLRNKGNAALAGLSLTITGDTGDFLPDPLPATTLAPNATLNFTVVFSPAALGSRAGTLLLSSDDPDQSLFSILLEGYGVRVPAISIEHPAGTVLTPRRVVAWGTNSLGERNVPSSLRGIHSIAAGSNHSLVLSQDGHLTAWGSNTYGEGNIPAGLSGIKSIRAGSNRSAALLEDGRAVLWGAGSVIPPGVLDNVRNTAFGSYHIVVLKGDGTVAAWGSNTYGESTVPAGLDRVLDVSAGNAHTLALKEDGTVIGWGDNSSGQRTVPAGLNGIRSIASGAYHNLALKTDGTVAAWGSNSFGASSVPAGLNNVQAIEAGGNFCMALKNDGTIAAWGANDSGQTSVPAGLHGVQDISAGFNHAVALVAAQAVFPARNVGTTGPAKSFLLKNSGHGLLNLVKAELVEGDAADFSINPAGLRSPLTPSAEAAILKVGFTPRAAGLRKTTLRITSNDPAESVFEIMLTGTGTGTALTTVQSWRQFYFGMSTNAGNAADAEDPDADGIVNLLEFAFGTDPTQPDSGPSGLEYVGTLEGNGTFTATGQPVLLSENGRGGLTWHALFVRKKGYVLAGLAYTPEFTADLTDWQSVTAPPTVLADDGIHQIVSVPYPSDIGGGVPRYFRVKVGLAP